MWGAAEALARRRAAARLRLDALRVLGLVLQKQSVRLAVRRAVRVGVVQQVLNAYRYSDRTRHDTTDSGGSGAAGEARGGDEARTHEDLLHGDAGPPALLLVQNAQTDGAYTADEASSDAAARPTRGTVPQLNTFGWKMTGWKRHTGGWRRTIDMKRYVSSGGQDVQRRGTFDG